MPRVKSSPRKCIKSAVQTPNDRWVFLIKGEALKLPEQYTGAGTPDLVTLRHPKTGESAMFLFSATNNSVQEILTFDEGKRSWFIDEHVKSDGKMHLSTPIDPIFLVLPYLRKYCSNQAVPLDHILRDEDFPESERLIKTNGLKYLNLIADKKGSEDLNAFKYNEEKTLLWLKKKTEKVSSILKQKNIHVSSGVVSATFIKPTKNDSVDAEAYLRYAHGIVSEYLMEDLSLKLLKYLGLPEEVEFNLKRKSTGSNLPESKKPKTDEETRDIKNANINVSSNALDLSKPEPKLKPPTLTAKERAREKAASGSKNIASFFKKA